MDEFRHDPSDDVVERGSFPFRDLEMFARARFMKCPKFLTLMRHADLLETTPIYCHDKRPYRAFRRPRKKYFMVPKQELIKHTSTEGLRIFVLRVFEKGVGPRQRLWLVVCSPMQHGYTIPAYMLNEKGELPKSEREARRLLRHCQHGSIRH
jgi:hypothetical protein